MLCVTTVSTVQFGRTDHGLGASRTCEALPSAMGEGALSGHAIVH